VGWVEKDYTSEPPWSLDFGGGREIVEEHHEEHRMPAPVWNKRSRRKIISDAGEPRSGGQE
jgi:hypothetical protein